MQEPTVLNVPTPVTVVGDIHGQLQDLLVILTHEGLPPGKNYLFLGGIENKT